MPAKKTPTNRYFIFSLLLIAGALFAYVARGLIAPLIIAALLAYLLNPLVTVCTVRLRMKRMPAVILVYILFIVALVTSSILLAPVLIRQVQNLTQAVQDFMPRLETILSEPIVLMGVPVNLEGLYEDLRTASGQLFVPDRLFSVIKSATTNVAWILVIFVTAYYLLHDWEKLVQWLVELAPKAYRPDLREIHEEIKLIWSGYLRGQLLLMLVIGLISTISAAAIGLPDAILIGLIAGGIDFIPTLGPAVATAIAALIAFTRGSLFLPLSPIWFVVLVVIVFQLIQLAESVWFQPRILGRRLHMHRGVVFVAVISALTLGSILLALIIVPVIASLGVFGRYIHHKLLTIQ
jgi:predicted PurR-regulated permease PerM